MGIEKRSYRRKTKTTIGDIVKGVAVVGLGAGMITLGTWTKKEFETYPTVTTYNKNNIDLRSATADEFLYAAGNAIEKTLPYGMMFIGGLVTLKGIGYAINRTYKP